MLVTVILPIYNKEKDIKKSVESILSQTHTNLEIILVNDGSTDNSLEICKKMEIRDQRIKVISQKNQGVSVARNTGMYSAKGDYIMFVDPDDWLNENIIKELLIPVIEKKWDIVACCTEVHLQGECFKNSFLKLTDSEVSKRRIVAQLFSNDHYNDSGDFIDIGVVWAKIYKKKFLQENNLKFNSKLRRMQDNIFNLYAFEKSNGLYYIDEPLYNYNFEHISGTSRKFISDAEEMFHNNAVEKLKFYNKYYADDELISLLLDKCLANYLLNILVNNTCHPEFEGNIEDRIKKMKYLCEETVFQRLFKSNNKLLKSRIKNIFINLLSKGRYKKVYYLIALAYKFDI